MGGYAWGYSYARAPCMAGWGSGASAISGRWKDRQPVLGVGRCDAPRASRSLPLLKEDAGREAAGKEDVGRTASTTEPLAADPGREMLVTDPLATESKDAARVSARAA